MKNLLTTIILFIIAVNIAFAGVKLEFKNYDEGDESNSEINTAIFTPDKLRIENKSKDDVVTIIYNGPKEKIIIIMEKDKTYMVMDKEMLENLGKQMAGVMEQMKQQLANLPEAQRKQMEKMMGAQMGGIDVEYKLVNTGIKKKINDWNTVKYNLKADEKLMSEIWAAPYSSVGISESDMNVMKSFSNFMKDMVKSVPMAQKDPFSAVYDEFKGVPIKTLNKTSNSVSELVSVKDYTPKDSDFIVPSGYEEKKIPMNGGR